MIRAEDPLAHDASTWDSLEPGPPCVLCKVRLERGHRHYQDESGVVHYACLAEQEHRLAIELHGISRSIAAPDPYLGSLPWASEVDGECYLCDVPITTGDRHYEVDDRVDLDVDLHPVYAHLACFDQECRSEPVSLPEQPAVATQGDSTMSTTETTAPTTTPAPAPATPPAAALAAATAPVQGQTAEQAPAVPKKKVTPPVVKAERELGKQVKLLSDSGASETLLDGMRGAQRLLQTLDQIAAGKPVEGTAWAAVVALGASQRLLEDALAGKAPADLF